MANSIFPFVWPTQKYGPAKYGRAGRLRLYVWYGSFIKRVTLTRTAARGLRNGALPRAVESRAIDACWH
eukprot:COSAG06_NODE_10508_length_1669_cov_1.508280_1_plen_68_part_10